MKKVNLSKVVEGDHLHFRCGGYGTVLSVDKNDQYSVRIVLDHHDEVNVIYQHNGESNSHPLFDVVLVLDSPKVS